MFCAEKKKWKPEIKDSWMTFFSSIVKVMKKSETKAEKENQNDPDEHSEHMTGQYRQVRIIILKKSIFVSSVRRLRSHNVCLSVFHPFVHLCQGALPSSFQL